MRKNLYLFKAILLFTGLTGIYCQKKFDAPPPYMDPDIQPNLTIKNLRAMHIPSNFEGIPDDLVIEGIVTANDEKDNFYKSIILQDSTGGITIRLDGFGLYNHYPVGRKLAVKLKGLWMGEYARMLQLGGSVDRSDPSAPELMPLPVPLFERHLIKKSFNNPVIPRQVRLDALHDSLQSCLVMINDLEFALADTGTSYADAVNKITDNKMVKSCSGGSVYLRTSGFAKFAAAKTPRGNGSLTAVYSVFRNEKQLLLRDTADVHFTGLRCTGSGFKVLFNEDFETISANNNVAIRGWKNIAESGGKLFLGKTMAGNAYAEISAFATHQNNIISWLILPPVNLSNSANEILGFQTRDGFDNGATLQVLVSTNYDGGNTPWKAKWLPLKAAFSKGSVSAVGSNWVSSGKVSLAGLQGLVYIAFRYDGADPAFAPDKRTTSFQLDNIRIDAN